jgi:hypothetical protein
MMLYGGKAMARTGRKKKDKIRPHKEAKRKARTVVGMPPPARVVPEKRDKPEKHRKRRDESEGL